MRRSIVLGFVLLAGGPLLAQQLPAPPPEGRLAARRLEVRRATGPIVIDGVLDEAAWAAALTYELPYEWQPGDNTPPPVATDFLVTYDDRRLYVAWRCHDPRPGEIRAHLMDRDSIDTFVQDDHVLLMIDPFNDERRGWQFRINPLGVQADAIFSENEGIEDFSYDLIWDAAGRIGAEGYVVEVAIPFSQLRFPRSAEPQTWGFDVGRSYPRSVRHRINSWPRDRGRNCLLCQIDKVSGFVGLEPGRNVELDPTVTASRTDVLDAFPDGHLETGEEDYQGGLSARWGITSDLSLNAAWNPDFSQVEADAAQLQVNERFALFYAEKRPFFLEGVDVFSTPFNAVYTRTVVDPDWGLKVTGKIDGSAIGVFAADDDFTNLVFPGAQGSRAVSLAAPNTSAVARYRRDIGRGSTIGALYTGRDGEQGYRNDLYGLDAFLRFGDNDTVRLQALRSDTAYPEAVARQFGQPLGDFGGEAYSAIYQHGSRDWTWQAVWEGLGEGFRADSGFIPQVGIRRSVAIIQRNFWGEKDDWWTRWDAGFSGRQIDDAEGETVEQRLDLYAEVAGPLQSFISLSLEHNQERAGPQLFEDLDRQEVYLEVQPRGWLKLTLYGDHGETVFFATGQEAKILVVQPTAELKLGRHVNLQLNHTLQRFERRGTEISEANLTQLKLVYNFSVRAFVRGIVQYFDLQQNPAAFPEPVDASEESVFTQLLFSYKLNPQTVLFLGYSDNRLGVEDISLTRTDRTFFAKLGYALVF